MVTTTLRINTENSETGINGTHGAIYILNLVERFIGLITQKQIGRSDFASVKEFEKAIYEYIEAHNMTLSRQAPGALLTGDVNAMNRPIMHDLFNNEVSRDIDNVISKTISISKSYDFERFSSIYQQTYRLGLKVCTTYRLNLIRNTVLSSKHAAVELDY